MLKFFTTIFGNKVRRAQRPATRLGVEELTPRVLPSAGCMASGGSSSQSAQSAFSSSFDGGGDFGGFGGFGGFGFGGHFRAAHATLAGSLSDSAGATGEASFNSNSSDLFVSVKGATASTALSVTLTTASGATTTLGTLTTNASGNGHARFSDVTAAAGDTITVGDLTGTLAQVKYSATLAGAAAGVSGSSSYNSVENELHVSIKGAEDKTTYNVSVNGTVVGQITTNRHGRGRLSTSPTGVTITSGSTISVADTTGDAAILTGSFA